MLALLLEAGDAQTVVAAGEEWLATHRRDPRARDVALSTALAHRALADTQLKKQGDAVSAAAMLEVAAELLAQHRGAAGLQAEVAGALAEVQPALACQLVSAPLERFQERERGVEVRCGWAGWARFAARAGLTGILLRRRPAPSRGAAS